MRKHWTCLTTAVNDATLRAYVWLQIYAGQEPVRLRAALLSAILAAGLYLGTDVSGWAETAATIGAVVLPVVVGESTRSRVTPAE
ncbi:hypothetical protein [Streptomyces sp. NPDC048603]|uniref:hypothetical protein n=1 Tax=Streptomyces sp. NPDC048603 TaxID=3365577 RepID=UPI00371849EB